MSLKLEAGKRYTTKDGLISTPLSIDNNHSIYRFGGKINDEYVTWTENGRYYIPGGLYELDLVAEYKEEKIPLKLEIGKRYICRNGDITSPLERHDNFIYRFKARCGCSQYYRTWNKNGRFDVYNSDNDKPDLIAEYKEESMLLKIETPTCQISEATQYFVFEKGYCWQAYGKQIRYTDDKILHIDVKHGYIYRRSTTEKEASAKLIHFSEIPEFNPPIKINDNIVEFTTEGIKVGCTEISREIVTQIYNKMMETK